ncbi:MAG: methyltransferase protein [Pseudonocardiales bacterium]|nr:methyltransferase protein [Pseudonocardiales bacterium]
MPLSKYDIKLDLAQAPDTSHRHIVEMVGSNKHVLDVGCDTGYLGETLIALGCRVSGVEINPVTAAEAATKLERVVVGDLESLDLVAELGERQFDVVVFGDVLEHLRDPLALLRQARRLLAPGGSVLVSTPNVAHGDVRLALLMGKFQYTRLGILDETHTRFFTTESLMQFAEDAGMDVVELRRTHAPLFGTEQAQDPADFPPDLIDALREDIEATTYQFVARFVPQDAQTQATAIARELDLVREELAALRRKVDSGGASVHGGANCVQAQADLEAHRATVESLRAQLDRALEAQREAQAQAHQARDLAAQFERSRSVRAARSVRRITGRR